MTGIVYECNDCGERTDQRRCEDCNRFTRRAGAGGHCPSCDELILVEELLDQTNHIAPPYTEGLTSSPCVSVTAASRRSTIPPGRDRNT